jgi:hypothetical protein
MRMACVCVCVCVCVRVCKRKGAHLRAFRLRCGTENVGVEQMHAVLAPQLMVSRPAKASGSEGKRQRSFIIRDDRSPSAHSIDSCILCVQRHARSIRTVRVEYASTQKHELI